jgi:hypothetical protein
MSRIFNKLKDGGARLFSKMRDGAPKLMSKLHDGLTRSSDIMNRGSKFLSQAGDYGNRIINNPASIAAAASLGVAPEFLAGGNALIGASRVGSNLLRQGAQGANQANNVLERTHHIVSAVNQGPLFA